jgi:hypothetical protein
MVRDTVSTLPEPVAHQTDLPQPQMFTATGPTCGIERGGTGDNANLPLLGAAVDAGTWSVCCRPSPAVRGMYAARDGT